jgi:predicted DNA-binding transcriptional regulator AlpA
MSKRYLRKRAVTERYGGVSIRTIERMVKDGRLPPPEYPLGRLPMWDAAKLDEFDRAATLAPRPKQTSRSAEG